MKFNLSPEELTRQAETLRRTPLLLLLLHELETELIGQWRVSSSQEERERLHAQLSGLALFLERLELVLTQKG